MNHQHENIGSESKKRMNNREHSSNNVQTSDDAEISNIVATTAATNSHLTPSEANFFQAFIRMAVAVFLVSILIY
uniref:Uncharacterized protein n=1 Tax=Meloidogyne floridensis TaxID=298350 RepID=A0A915NF56_9BILA